MKLLLISQAVKVSKPLFLAFAFLITSFSTETKEEYIQPALIKHYTGTINGKYRIFMNLTPNNSVIEGHYRYATQKSFLAVKGTLDNAAGTMHLEENSGDKVTGVFDGLVKGRVITGTWSNADKTKTFPFELTTDHQDIDAKFLVTYKADDDRVSLEGIIVVTNGKTVSLTMGDDLNDSGVTAMHPTLTLEDVNFDGYPDLSTIAMEGMVNASYYFWLYDPLAGGFVYNEQLHGMSNPEVDVQNKQIKTFARNSAASYTYINYVYADKRYKEVYNQTKSN